MGKQIAGHPAREYYLTIKKKWLLILAIKQALNHEKKPDSQDPHQKTARTVRFLLDELEDANLSTVTSTLTESRWVVAWKREARGIIKQQKEIWGIRICSFGGMYLDRGDGFTSIYVKHIKLHTLKIYSLLYNNYRHNTVIFLVQPHHHKKVIITMKWITWIFWFSSAYESDV